MNDHARFDDELSELELDVLLEHCNMANFEKEEVILQQGELDDHCVCLIMVGQVKVAFQDEKQGKTLAILRNGDIFGEFSLFTREARSANVIALEYTELLKIDLHEIDLMFETEPKVAFKLVKYIAKEASKKLYRRSRK